MVQISTIGISRDTRELLKTLGKKGDTYDELIRRLVNMKIKNNKDSFDGRFASLQSSESHSA
jgi:predicted CopG family antitoxin